MLDAVEFVDEPCDVEIKRGVVYLIWPNGRRAFPIDVFRANMARCQKALAEFDAKRGVVSIRKGHAASSA